MKTIQELAELSLKKAVLIDFWAEWCGPCKTFGPVIDKVLSKYPDQLQLEKVDVDKQSDLAAQFRVQNIPTIVLLSEGKISGVSKGVMSETQLEQWLKKHLPTLTESCENGDWRSVIADLPPVPSPQRLEILRGLAKDRTDEKELLMEYCRALVFEVPEEALELARNLRKNSDLQWLSNQIIYLADLLAADTSPSAKANDIENELKNARLENAASLLVDQVLKADADRKEDLRKIGVALFAILGDLHPVNQKYRKLFNMYLS